MKNFITNFVEIAENVVQWLILVVGLASIIMVAFTILFVLFVLDMIVLNVFRAIINHDTLTDAAFEELELWCDLFKDVLKPYFTMKEEKLD